MLCFCLERVCADHWLRTTGGSWYHLAKVGNVQIPALRILATPDPYLTSLTTSFSVQSVRDLQATGQKEKRPGRNRKHQPGGDPYSCYVTTRGKG